MPTHHGGRDVGLPEIIVKLPAPISWNGNSRMEIVDLKIRPLARLTGYSPSYISRLFSSDKKQRRDPSLQCLRKLAVAMNIPMDVVLDLMDSRH